MGTSTSRGRFDRLFGHVLLNPQAKLLQTSITVDVNSLSTGLPAFDQVIKGSRLLDTASHPQAYFTARQTEWDGDAPREVRGELTLKGISQPLSLRATRWKCGLNPLIRRRVCGGDFEATLDRNAYEMGFGVPWVAQEVRLLIQVEAWPVEVGDDSAGP